MKLDTKINTYYDTSVDKNRILYIQPDGTEVSNETFVIPKELKKRFRDLCADSNISAAEMLRGFVADFVKTKGTIILPRGKVS